MEPDEHYRLVDESGGPRVVELLRYGTEIVHQFGRHGELEERSETVDGPPEQVQTQVRRLVARLRHKGYRLGSYNAQLEAGIRSLRGDPAAVLIYADWLQEQADVRGELIRTQFALEHGEDPALRARQTRLLSQHAVQLVPHQEGLEFAWRRGWIDGMRLHVASPVQDWQRAFGGRVFRAVKRHPSGRFASSLDVVQRNTGAVVQRVVDEPTAW